MLRHMGSRRRIWTNAAVLLLVLSGVVAACGGGASESDEPRPTSTPRVAATPTWTPMPTATPTATFAPAGPTATPVPGPGAGSRIPWNDGEWYIQGVNIPWYQWGCDFGCGNDGGVSSKETRDAMVPGFELLRDAGLHHARWWLFPGEPWQIEQGANGTAQGINEAVFADIDAAVELAREYDFYLTFVIFSAPSELSVSWLGEPAARAAAVTVLGDLFERYANEPRIFSWEVFNEPEWEIWRGDAPQRATIEFVGAVVAEANERTPAHISVGSANLDGLSLWSGLGFDYYDAHWYDPMPDEVCALCLDYETIRDRYNLDAPLVVGEFYGGLDVDTPSRLSHFYDNGFAGAWPWSLFSDRTEDKLQVDLDSLRAFVDSHPDIGPR